MAEKSGFEDVRSSAAKAVGDRLNAYEKQRSDPKLGDKAWWAADAPVLRGNTITPLIHGDAYFKALLGEFNDAKERVYITGWSIGLRLPLERKEGKTAEENDNASRFGYALGNRAKSSNVDARILVWLNPFELTSFNGAAHTKLMGDTILVREANGLVLHQKTVVVDGETAFCGGIDITALGGDHWDTPRHRNKEGDKAPLQRYKAHGKEEKYWHDVQLKIEGSAVAAIEANFAERWAENWWKGDPGPLPPKVAAQRAKGRTVLQVVRTLPPASNERLAMTFDGDSGAREPPRSFQREEYSILEAYERAIINAERFIYIENQYFTCEALINLLKRRLAAVPTLSLIFLLPKKSEISYPDEDRKYRFRAAFSRGVASEKINAAKAAVELREAAPDRVVFASPVNADGEDIYVHSKLMIVDDTYATVGSANISQRSMFTDQEIGVAWMDAEGETTIRDLRYALWTEHLGYSNEDLKQEKANKVLEQEEAEAKDLNRPMAALWRERMGGATRSPRIQEWPSPRQPAGGATQRG